MLRLIEHKKREVLGSFSFLCTLRRCASAASPLLVSRPRRRTGSGAKTVSISVPSLCTHGWCDLIFSFPSQSTQVWWLAGRFSISRAHDRSRGRARSITGIPWLSHPQGRLYGSPHRVVRQCASSARCFKTIISSRSFMIVFTRGALRHCTSPSSVDHGPGHCSSLLLLCR